MKSQQNTLRSIQVRWYLTQVVDCGFLYDLIVESHLHRSSNPAIIDCELLNC